MSHILELNFTKEFLSEKFDGSLGSAVMNIIGDDMDCISILNRHNIVSVLCIKKNSPAPISEISEYKNKGYIFIPLISPQLMKVYK